MAGLYVDTLAIGRVLLAEPDAQVIIEAMARSDAWHSSAVLALELRRLAWRSGLEEEAERILAQVSLRMVDGSALERAARVEPVTVRSLDAIHLDAALALRGLDQINAVLTYDRQLQDGCAHHGLAVDAPV